MSKRLQIITILALSLSGSSTAQTTALADPMRPKDRQPASAARTTAPLRLEGIVISDSRKLALIDGEFLEEGQQIYGVRIEKIERETVTVRRNGRTLVLRPESAAVQTAAESGESQ